MRFTLKSGAVKHRAALAAASIAALFVARSAAAAPQDAQAKRAISDAVEKDFLETRFDDAEKKLRGAADKCGTSGCSPAVKAKVYAALGSVLASGKKQLADAKEAFIEAIALDKAVKPNAEIASTEADYAFDLAKKEVKPGGKRKVVVAAPPPSSGANEGDACKHDEDCSGNLACQNFKCQILPDGPIKKKKPPPDEKTDDSKDDDKDKDKDEKERKNWFTIVYSPDLAVYAGKNVCTKTGQTQDHFYCLRGNNSHYVGTPTANNADDVTPGVALGSMRVVVGYERIVASNVGLGARIGFAFNGATQGGASFMPVHAEARFAYYIGHKPFVGTGVRPSVFLSGGAAEVDTQVQVNVLEDGATCGAKNPGSTSSPCTKPSHDGVLEKREQQLTAYKQAGPGFAGGGVAFAFAPVESAEFHVGVRAAVTFPSAVFWLAPEAGFALGF